MDTVNVYFEGFAQEEGAPLTRQLNAAFTKENWYKVVQEKDESILVLQNVSQIPSDEQLDRERMTLFLVDGNQTAAVEEYNERKKFLLSAAVGSNSSGSYDQNAFKDRIANLIRSTLSVYKLHDALTLQTRKLQLKKINTPEKLLAKLSGFDSLQASTAELRINWRYSDGVKRLFSPLEEGADDWYSPTIAVSLYGEAIREDVPSIVLVQLGNMKQQTQMRQDQVKRLTTSLNIAVYVPFMPPVNPGDGHGLIQEGLDQLNNRGGLLQWSLLQQNAPSRNLTEDGFRAILSQLQWTAHEFYSKVVE